MASSKPLGGPTGKLRGVPNNLKVQNGLPPHAQSSALSPHMTHGPPGCFDPMTGPPPPIFVGHVGKTAAMAELCSTNTPYAYEVFLGGSYLLAGIHIVPNQISTPVQGLGFSFEGKTKPELHIAPFLLKIFGRNLDTNDLILVQESQIQGGVQWLPVLDAVSMRIAVDYLVFAGTFDTLSVIVHGSPLEKSVLSEAARGSLDTEPIRKLLGDAEADDSGEEDGPGGVVNAEVEVVNQKRVNTMLQYTFQRLETAEKTIQNILGSLGAPSEVARSSLQSCCISRSGLVSLASASALVGKIFSLDFSAYAASKSDGQVGLLKELDDGFSACWASVSPQAGKDSSSYATFESSLDQEAAALAATFLQQGLQLILTTLLTESAGSSKVVSKDRESLVSAMLLCCNACLVNEIFAGPFLACGGPAVLVDLTMLLTRDSTKGVSALLTKALRCLKAALLHEVLASAFLQLRPNGGATAYQQLLMYYKTLRIANVPPQVEHLLEDILNWSAHADALITLRQRCQLALNDIPVIAEAAALQFSHYNLHAAQAAEADEEADSALAGRDDRVDVACSKLDGLLGDLLESLDECASATKECARAAVSPGTIHGSRLPENVKGEETLFPAALLALRHGCGFVASLSVVAAVARSASELAAGVDWRAGGRTACLLSRVTALRKALFHTLLGVLRGEHADLLFALAHAESRLLAQFLCARDSVHAAIVSPAVMKGGGFVEYSERAFSSVGRVVEISLAVTALVNMALSNSERLLRSPQAGEEQASPSHQELRALQDCFRQLAQLAEDRIGMCVVGESVAAHLVPVLLAAVRSDSPVAGIGEAAARLGADASLLLRMCAEQASHPPVARRLRDRAAGAASALQAVATGSLFDMQSKAMKDNLFSALALVAFTAPSPDDDPYASAVAQFNLQVLNNGSAVNSTDLRRLLVAVNIMGVEAAPALVSRLAPLAELLAGALAFFSAPAQLARAGAELLLAMELRRADGVSAARERTNVELLSELLVSCLQGLASALAAGPPSELPAELLLQTVLGAHARILAAGAAAGTARYSELGGLDSLAHRATILVAQMAALGVTLPTVARRGMAAAALLPSLVLSRAIVAARPSEMAVLGKCSATFAVIGDSGDDLAEDPLGSLLVSSANGPAAASDVCALILAGQASAQLLARRCSRALIAAAASAASSAAFSENLLSAWCLGFTRRATHLLLLERRGAEDPLIEELKLETSAVLRLLVDVEQLLSSPHSSLALLETGLLLPLLTCLHSKDKDVVILALQAMVATHRGLACMVTTLDKSSAVADPRSLRGRLLVCTEGLMDGVVSLLPAAISKFQDKDSISLWMQAVQVLQLLPLKHLKLFLEALSPTVGIEVLGVKIWQAFEDSFQGLIEITDVLKAAAGEQSYEALLGEDRGQRVLAQAHRQIASASAALKAVTEVAINAFCQGYITSPTLSKVIRYHLTDPKKAAHRFQRSYTMWSTQILDDRFRSMLRLGVYLDAAAAGGGDDEPLYAASFEATHAIVMTSLKHLVDLLGRATRLAQSREERVVQQVPLYSIGDASKGFLELASPVGAGALREWLQATEGDGAQQEQHDLLHGLLRGPVLAGLYGSADGALKGLRCLAHRAARKREGETPSKRPKA